MVKVFPTSFNFIEKQKLLTKVSGEPLAITCSDECLFVAEENCLLEVFDIESLKPMGQFRTVSPVQHLVYNPKGDCIVTLEKKNPTAQGFARVYFKWRGASVDKPVRISLLGSLSQSALLPGDHLAADIVELPAELNSSVSCLACCEESGRIAMGMGSKVRIFTLTTIGEGRRRGSSSVGGLSSEDAGTGLDLSTSDLGDTPTLKPRLVLMDTVSAYSHPRPSPRNATPSFGSCHPDGSSMSSHSIDLLLDIATDMQLHSIAIFNNYVACISANEVHVLKIALLADTTLCSSSTSAMATALTLEEPTPSVSPAATPHPDSSTHQVSDLE